MQHVSSRILGAVLCLTGILAAPLAQAQQLNWDDTQAVTNVQRDPETGNIISVDPLGPANMWPPGLPLDVTFLVTPGNLADGVVNVSIGNNPNQQNMPCMGDCTAYLSGSAMVPGPNPPATNSPALNILNTGGTNPPKPSLYIATDYPAGSGLTASVPGDDGAPAVSITFNFDPMDYPNGVGGVKIDIFDLDAADDFHDDVTVAATLVNGTTIYPAFNELLSSADNQIAPSPPPAELPGISGIPGSGTPSNSADANSIFRLAGPGIEKITIIYRNIIALPTQNPGFQTISINNIEFTPSSEPPPEGLTPFDNTTIIGKVFNDLDEDGWQDPGEDGVPGVRLITPDGLLIETDSHGRYHIAAVDGGFADRGRNYIVKVDPATLPKGTEFVTENPRQKRITRGLMNRFDFGVRLPGEGPCCEEVELKLSELFFEPGSAELRPEYTRVLRQFADLLGEQVGGVITISGNTAPDELGPSLTPSTETVTQYQLTPHFGVRQATLTPGDRAELDRIADEWRGIGNIRIEAIGHTSNVRIAPQNRQEFADNYALSKARAAAVAEYLRNAMGLGYGQISTAGRGPDEPVASNATVEGRAANRRVELSITGSVFSAASGDDRAKKLADDRALRVYLALKGLLGEEKVRSVDFRFAYDPPVQPAGPQCGIEPCAAEPLYAFELLTGQSTNKMPGETRFARENEQRVDVRGMFTIAMPGGGVVSATEDPVIVEPRLAALGPPTLPFSDGQITATSVFSIYMNYAAFIDCAELLIFRANDVDLVRPLARLSVPITTFSSVRWDGATGREKLRGDEELIYFVKVCDKPGHIDKTAPQSIQLVSERHYLAATSTRLVPSPAIGGEASVTSVLSNDTPLGGSVLVFQPSAPRSETQEFTFRPRFDTRKTDLKPEARARLDKIAEQWRGIGDIYLETIGHTDSIRIAPQHRDEFANNQVLSEARATVVAQYLARALGLGSDRISSSGRGPLEPIASNATAEGRAQNRRVELRISGNRVERTEAGQAVVTLIDPGSGAEESVLQSLREAMNVLEAKKDIAAAAGESVGQRTTMARATPALLAQASAEALALLYGRNDLVQQNIPIRGSRVRVRGRDFAASHGLNIDTIVIEADEWGGKPDYRQDMSANVKGKLAYRQAVPLDANGQFAVEYLMPIGQYSFDVRFLDAEGQELQRDTLPLEVTGEHMFAVAMVDLTLANNDATGLVQPLTADSRYKDDFLAEGRVAFYLKGRIKGKYLVTAQLDTQEEQLDNIISNLDKEDPRAIFRRIDPDLYYPVYGDDSTTISDTDSQGRLYARIEWDRSKALWGNYHTGITGNEFAQYNRSLYGGQVHYRSIDTTGLGAPKIEGQLFASDTQTALGHVEFVGTAGSLYYLKHTDVLQGSEKARVELRDRDSGRVIANHTLVREVDYEIDEIQGRIILARPLPSITNLLVPGLIRDTPLDGNDVVLIVDYEYLPSGFNPDQMTSGARGKYWLNEILAVGATWVDESRPGEDYSLYGGDVTLQLGRGTYLKAEYADSTATQTGRFSSADGGLSFSSLLNPATGRSGDAYGIEGRMNSAEFLGTEREWIAAAWWRRTDDNFSVARRDPGDDIVEMGAELTGEVSERLSVAARLSMIERESTAENEITRFAVQADYRLGEKSTLSGELRTEERRFNSGAAEANSTLGAVRYGYRFTPDIELYGIGQFTLDNECTPAAPPQTGCELVGLAPDLTTTDNDLLTIGAKARVTTNAQVQGEYSTGDRGDSARVGFDYTLNSQRHLYGTYTHSTDRTDPFGGNQAVIGQRSQISNQTEVFVESQFTRRDDQAGLAHVFGLDFKPGSGWTAGFNVQTGEVLTDLYRIDRDAASVSASYHSPDLSFASRVEYREDTGDANLRQWLSSNRFDYKFSEDLRVLAKLNYSDTNDEVTNANGANFLEGTIGAAYRPTSSDRLNVLSKYTYLSDLRGPEQIIAGADQRSHIITSEFIYRINNLFDLGSKLGWRQSELRAERNAGEWTDNTTVFGAVRGTYHLLHKWDAIAEFRMLDVENSASTRQGFLVEVDRHFGGHLKLGLGYNFTEFSDDLTIQNFDARGFFINATGKY